MKIALISAFALMMLLVEGYTQPASARIVTIMPVVHATCCGTDAALLNIDLSASPPSCSYPLGLYGQCPDYRNDFFAGEPCTNVILPAAAIVR